MEGVGRVPAPHDHQLGMRERVVFVAVFDGAEGHARREGRPLVGRHRPGTGAAAGHAHEAAEQAFDLVRLVEHAERGAGVRLVEQGSGAVFRLDLLHLVRGEAQRFLPGDALELALAALAHAQHRVEQALGGIEPGAVGTAAQAGAELRLLEGVLAELTTFLVAPVVGRKAHDDVALLVRDKHVPGAAIMRAARHHRGQIVVARIRLVGEAGGGLRAARARKSCRGACRGQPQEVAPVRIERRLPRNLVPGTCFPRIGHRYTLFLAFCLLGFPGTSAGPVGREPADAWENSGEITSEEAGTWLRIRWAGPSPSLEPRHPCRATGGADRDS